MGSGYGHSRRLAVQLNSALEARGRSILQSSNTEISIRQFEELFTWDVSERLTDISVLLRGAGREKEPLTLTEARSIYSCCLIDTLCSVLERLQWRQFCSQLDALAKKGRAARTADCTLDCLFEGVFLWEQVQPPRDAETARLEAFGRYCCLALKRCSPPFWLDPN